MNYENIADFFFCQKYVVVFFCLSLFILAKLSRLPQRTNLQCRNSPLALTPPIGFRWVVQVQVGLLVSTEVGATLQT